MAEEKPAAAPVFLSRGARLAAYALAPLVFVVVLAELAAFVAFLQRRMTWIEYLGAAFVGIFGGALAIVPLIRSVIEGWTRQDEAKIAASAPRPDAPTATATTNVVVPSKEA